MLFLEMPFDILLFDLFLVQVRVSKEQDHVLIIPQGLSFTEVTAGSLVGIMVHAFSYSRFLRTTIENNILCFSPVGEQHYHYQQYPENRIEM